MGNPLPVIDAITEGFYKPTLNAAGVDAKGNYVDAKGNPTTLYSQPGFWQKAFNPNADAIANLNLQGQQSGLVAQHNAALQKQQAIAANWGALPDADKAAYGNNPDQWYAMTGGNPQQQEGFNSALTSNAKLQGGYPQLAANADITGASALQQENNNRIRAAAASGLLGNPEYGAGVENQQLGYQSGELSGNTALQPQKFANLGLGMSNENTQLLGQQAALPDINAANLLNANTSKLQAQTGNTYEPLVGRAQAISGLYEAEHPQIYSNPLAGNVDPNTGLLTLGRTPMQTAMQGMMASQMGGAQPTQAPPGIPSLIRPQAQQTFDPLHITTNGSQLVRGGIPVSENNITDPESFQNPNQAHKPLTTGQRLLQGISPTLGGGINPNASMAAMNAHRAMQSKQADQQRIQQLTSILTNPPKHSGGKAGLVSDYTHDQLQDMADELDKLLGE